MTLLVLPPSFELYGCSNIQKSPPTLTREGVNTPQRANKAHFAARLPLSENGFRPVALRHRLSAVLPLRNNELNDF